MHCDFENNYQALVANGSNDIKIEKKKSGDFIQIKIFSHYAPCPN
jgi:hypothetical protein